MTTFKLLELLRYCLNTAYVIYKDSDNDTSSFGVT